jgi:thimet oligopeptidase
MIPFLILFFSLLLLCSGHGVHNLASQAVLPRFAGTAVERDFVEAPSQMLENWCWEPEPLERLSRHIETGESIPTTMVEKLIAAKNANVGLLTCRQLFFGIFDQTIHSRRESDTAAVLKELHDTVMRVPMTEGTNFSASFGHMCG